MDRVIVLQSCKDCPFVRVDRDYTEDSFEMVFKWTCTKLKADVRRYVEWKDHSNFIPDACPLDVHFPNKEN